jgi:lysozyme family protein
MMSLFDQCYAYTMANEGGGQVTNNPSDPGGITRYGVSLRFYRSYSHNPTATAATIENLSQLEAKEIAHNAFWMPLNLDMAQEFLTARAIFDCGYLSGIANSALCSQSALKQLGYDLLLDGILGSKSWKSLNECGPDIFLPAFVQIICNQFEALVDQRPKDSEFIKGWLARAQRLIKIS